MASGHERPVEATNHRTAASDQRADCSRAGIQRDQRTLTPRRRRASGSLALDGRRLNLDGPLCRLLGFGIERRVDDEISRRGGVVAEHGVDSGSDRVERVGAILWRAPLGLSEPQGLLPDLAGELRRDVALLRHEREHQVAPGPRSVRVPPRSVERWTLRQTRPGSPLPPARAA